MYICTQIYHCFKSKDVSIVYADYDTSSYALCGLCNKVVTSTHLWIKTPLNLNLNPAQTDLGVRKFINSFDRSHGLFHASGFLQHL